MRYRYAKLEGPESWVLPRLDVSYLIVDRDEAKIVGTAATQRQAEDIIKNLNQNFEYAKADQALKNLAAQFTLYGPDNTGCYEAKLNSDAHLLVDYDGAFRVGVYSSEDGGIGNMLEFPVIEEAASYIALLLGRMDAIQPSPFINEDEVREEAELIEELGRDGGAA